MTTLAEIKAKLLAGSIKLSAALIAMREASEGRMMPEESFWLESEIRGYTVSESMLEGVPSGFADDADSVILPEYRKLIPISARATRPTGQVIDVSNTDFGRMPNLQIQGIPGLENTGLPMIERREPIGDRSVMPNGDVADRIFSPDSILRIFSTVQNRLIEIIDRLSNA